MIEHDRAQHFEDSVQLYGEYLTASLQFMESDATNIAERFARQQQLGGAVLALQFATPPDIYMAIMDEAKDRLKAADQNDT